MIEHEHRIPVSKEILWNSLSSLLDDDVVQVGINTCESFREIVPSLFHFEYFMKPARLILGK